MINEIMAVMSDRYNKNNLGHFLERPGFLVPGDFEPAEEIYDFMKNDSRILVVGAGGLGCELLKDLALTGFGNIDVIDMDTIDVSNLNRQFLFRPGDVGKAKATVAAERVMERVEGVRVTAHTCMIQEKPVDFYRQFHVIVLGLDSLEARRHMNTVACSFLEYDEEGKPLLETIKPIVDGGTEGFKGHARVLLPGVTPCFECTLWMFPPQTKYPLCTLAETPRSAPHCIEYAKIAMWPAAFPGVDFDGDDAEHISWVYEKALERSRDYGIEGVTYQLTQGVVKNIIPAIASTNAIIAGICTLETLKIISMCSTGLDNMLMYVGTDSVYTLAARYEKDGTCVCCAPPVEMMAACSDTLEALVSQVMDKLSIEKRSESFSLSLNARILYSSKKGCVFQDTSGNLSLTLGALGFAAGTRNTLNINDKSLEKVAKVTLLIE